MRGLRKVRRQPVEVEVPELPLSAYAELIGPERFRALVEGAARGRAILDGHTVWNINSTSSGGGVAEMLRVLVGYGRGAGVDVRWMVIEGDPDFFAITKRIHNRIHGVAGDDGALGRSQHTHYRDVLGANAVALDGRLRPGDIVLLHDPQTAGLVEPLQEKGLRVVWRSHIGSDTTNRYTDEAWAFLRPYLRTCERFVFTRAAFAPSWIPADDVSVIPPSIDPFSPKNQDIAPEDVTSFLAQMGLGHGPATRPAKFRRHDGSTGTIERPASLVSEGGASPLIGALPVVQVSRWDRLKDMAGVMEGFAAEVVGRVRDAHLALVGPATEGVADDPEGAAVYGEILERWHALEREVRRRIALVTLPLVDVDENAAMVNAVQRASSVIVQKSLVEGFGLTVAEGMWKAKPIVASRVGGIIDQVVPGTGLLVDDPADLHAFGTTLAGLLEQPQAIARMGAEARRHVLQVYVGDQHLLMLAALLEGAAEDKHGA